MENFKKEGESIKKDLSRALSKEYIPQDSEKTLREYLGQKMDSYFLDKSIIERAEDKRERQRILNKSRSLLSY